MTVLLVAAGCQNPAPHGSGPNGPGIEIASEFPLSSSGPVPFELLERAVDVAVAEHPDVDGYRLVHVPLDDSLGGNFDIDRALQNARRAVRESPILGLVGPCCSDQARSLIPVTEPGKLVVLSPSNTADCLTDRPVPCLEPPGIVPTSYFRLAASDSRGARAAADFAVHKLGISRFAVLTDVVDFSPAQLMAGAFSEEVSRMGGKVAYSRDFTLPVTTFAPFLRDANAAGAQAVYLAAPGGACGMRQEMSGIFPATAYVISGDELANDSCITRAGLIGKTDDHLVTTISSGEPATIPQALKGVKRGEGYGVYTFAAYDCARILIAAIDRAIRANGGKIPTREQVRQQVAETSNFKGITGTFSFDANGDVATPSFSFYVVNQGSWAFWQNP